MMTRIAVRFSLLPAGSIAFPLKLDAFSVLFCMAVGYISDVQVGKDDGWLW